MIPVIKARRPKVSGSGKDDERGIGVILGEESVKDKGVEGAGVEGAGVEGAGVEAVDVEGASDEAWGVAVATVGVGTGVDVAGPDDVWSASTGAECCSYQAMVSKSPSRNDVVAVKPIASRARLVSRHRRG